MKTYPLVNLASLAPVVAAHLVGTWTAQRRYGNDHSQTDNYWILKRADGLALSVSANQYGHNGRISIFYNRPCNHRGEHVDVWENHNRIADPSITVAGDKTPDKIAQDITRRLLDESERVHALVRKQIEESRQYDEDKDALLLSLYKAAGLEPKRNYHNPKELDHSFYLPHPDDSDKYLGQHVSVTGRTAKITVDSLNAAQGGALIAFLKSDAYRML